MLAMMNKYFLRVKEKRKIFLLLAASFFFYSIFLYVSHEIIESKNNLDALNALDRGFLEFVVERRSHGLTAFLVSITYLGSGINLFLLSFVGLLFTHFKKLRSESFILAFSAAAAGVTIPLSKTLVDRPRPEAGLWLVTVDTLSFPSGHSAASASVLGAVFFLLGRSCLQPWQSSIIWLIGIAGIALLGFSRIYLGVHYPSDVIGGFLLGAATLFLGVSIDSMVAGSKKPPLL